MPPTGSLKADVNRSGWESSDFPSVCESCLPDNPFVQMIKENHGMECKICTRPFTVFRWAADRNSRFKKTNICLTCARLKNCCQCCMLDLTFGLPIVVRDAALKLVAQGPSSGINKEFYAQNNDGKLKDGEIPEEYEKTDAAARDLLKRLANSQPYYKKQRRTEGEAGEGSGSGQRVIEGRKPAGGPGPIRTQRGAAARGGRGGAGGPGGRKGFTAHGSPQDAAPPQDPTITSLFLTGVEDDLPEYAIRQFFEPFGALRSIVCVHRSRAAFVNFSTRAGAEAAAASCQGRAVIQGCPLRIQWGKPKPLGNFDRTQAALAAKAAAMAQQHRPAQERQAEEEEEEVHAEEEQGLALGQEEDIVIAPPPGADDGPKYQSQVPL